MKNVPAALLTHLGERVTTLAVCWRVERSDGVLILGTEHDRDITIAGSPVSDYAGTYVTQAGITGSDVKSTSDMSVDNMEVQGALNVGDLALVNLDAADVEAGLFDDAAVTLFVVNWDAPNDGQVVLRTGNVGEIRRTSENHYTTEVRGLAQKLTQNILRTYGTGCDAELGDSRCTVNVAALTLNGTVTAVTNNRLFTVSITPGSPTYTSTTFNGGLLSWVTGENATFSMEVKQQAFGSPEELQLYLPMPYDVEVGDTFTIKPGCDKSAAMCKGEFDNLANFRGHGAWVPGQGEVLVFGGQTPPKSDDQTLIDIARFLTYPRNQP